MAHLPRFGLRSAEPGQAVIKHGRVNSAPDPELPPASRNGPEPACAALPPSPEQAPHALAQLAEAQAGQGLKRWLRPFMLVLSLGFVAAAAVELAGRFQATEVEFRFGFVALSALPVLLGSLVQGAAWTLLIERMAERRVARRRALSLYLESQLARYTPGKVGLPLVRMAGARSLQLTAKVVGVSILVEMLSWTASGSLVSFGVLGLSRAPADGLSKLMGQFAWPLVGLSALGLVLLLAIKVRSYPEWLRKRLSVNGERALVPLMLPGVQVLYWALWAVHGLLLALSLGADWGTGLSSAGFFVLAPVLGFVALAAPAGVGVREAVLSVGLAPWIGVAPALAAAVLSRMCSLIADFGAFALARGLGWQKA